MIKPIKAIFNNNELGQKLLKAALLLIALVLYLPYAYVAILTVVTALSGLCWRFFRQSLLKYKGSFLAFVFLTVTAVVGLFNGNFLGFRRTCVFAAMLGISAAARSIMTKPFFEKLLDTVVLGGLMATVHSVIEFIVNHNVPDYRSQAFFTNPNFFGTALTFCILICAFKAATNVKPVWIYYCAAVVLAIGLYISGSMSLWLVAFIGILLMLIFLKNYKLLAIFCSIVAIGIVAILLIPGMIHRLDELSATIDNRLQIWDFAIEQFKTSPIFGRGFYTYKLMYNRLCDTQIIYPASMSHSMILDGFLCHGVVGMSIITAAVIRFYTSLFKTRKQLKNKGYDRSISGFILAVGIAVSLYGLMDTTFVWVQTGMILMFFTTGLGIEDKLNEN
ncbi:MAG: O-antigen ligase family protein [Clostridia bacterium]|nr:O-antigen ligase family protein [Clostridia bacterium]